MGNGITISVGGKLDGSFKGALSQAEREAKETADRITSHGSRGTNAPHLTGAARRQFVGEETAKSPLDAEKSRLAGVEEARRSIQARALLRKRADARAEAEETRQGLLIEQNLRDQSAVVEAQREEARRNIRSRALRRERAEERASKWQAATRDMRGNGISADGFNVSNGEGATVGLRRMAGGYAQLLHSARATFDSIASGQPIDRVIMQQAPQVVQALIQMKLGWVALGAAVLVAGHFVSRWVADTIYGVDAITAKGKQLESFRKMLHELVEEFKEGAKVKLEMSGAEFEGNDKDQMAQAKRRAAELALYKAELEKKNIAGQKAGNLDNATGDKISALEKEREGLKEDLKTAEARGQESPETAKLKKELDDLNLIPFNSRKDADLERMISLPGQIASSEQADKANKTAAVTEAQAKLLENQNEIDKFGIPEKAKTEKVSRAMKINETSLERSGVFANAGAVGVHDTIKEAVKQLKHINQNTSGFNNHNHRGSGRTRF